MKDKNVIENIIKRSQTKIAVSNFDKEEFFMPKNNKISKIVAGIILTLSLGTGLVYATTNLYEKIWKEPKSYTYEEMIKDIPDEKFSEEEKNSFITENIAKEKAIEILNKLGYANQNIIRIELKRGYDENNSYYMLKTKWGYEEGLMVQLKANNGNFISFNDMDLKYKDLKSEILTNEEISNVANDVYNKLEIDDELYKISNILVEDHFFRNKANKVMEAKFYKYYDGIANQYESFNVSFIAVDGKTLFESIILNTDDTYQKNPLVITKDDAINIVKNKEREFSTFDITNINANLSIEKMNPFIYRIENNKYDININSEEDTYYKTENITRMVWKVKVEHNINARNYIDDYNKYIKEGMDKFYYVDATTGEIIGGMHALF